MRIMQCKHCPYSPVIPFHLIRDAFRVAFCEIDRDLPFVDTRRHQWVTLSGQSF
jgi:hypothetical protein